MKQTIYIDVLMAVNFFINYYLLLASAAYLGITAKRGRFAAASALGAVFSLVILLPELPLPLSAAEKLVMSACMVLCAFGRGSLRRFLRCTAALFLISFAFAGLMVALWYFLAPQGMAIRNSVVYFNISPAGLILFAAACYGILKLIGRIAGKNAPESLLCRAQAERAGSVCIFTAKVDTGSSLREPFSGAPVVVANRSAVAHIIPPEDDANFRVVPYRSVSGDGLLKAFRPDRFVLHCGKQTIKTNKIYIAVSETELEGCDALLNPDLLQNTPG